MINRKLLTYVILSLLIINSIIPTITATAGELENERTEYTRTSRNTDLTKMTEVFSTPIFQQQNSTWVPIENIEAQVGRLSYISNQDQKANFSQEPKLMVGNDGANVYRSYIQFDKNLPDLKGGLLTNAVLKLHELNNPNTPGYGSPSYKNDQYSIHMVSGDWDPAQLNWENQPNISSAPYANLTNWVYVGGPSFSWDVTNLVNEWYKNPNAYKGLAIKALNEDSTNTSRTFYKASNDLNVNPVLQITYSTPPAFSSKLGYGLGPNTSQGYVNLQWYSVQGAKGYKIYIFNGKDYESIDIGNRTSWSSLGQNIWPTQEQRENGDYNLRLDGTGTNLADDPSSVYQHYPEFARDAKKYYFKVAAYNDFGESKSDEISIQLPDQTPLKAPSNLHVKNELYSSFTIGWDQASYTGDSQVVGYDVKVGSAPGKSDLYSGHTFNSEIQLPEGVISPRFTYYISVRAVDSNQNHSEYIWIQAKGRQLKDASILRYSIPVTPVDVNDGATASVTVQNEGAETWTKQKGYVLKMEGTSLTVPLNETDMILPDQEKTFQFNLKGFEALGEWPGKWRMYHPDTGFFGSSVETTIHFVDTKSPDIAIQSPEQDAKVTGNVPIIGMISDYKLKEYRISYGKGISPSTWVTISEGTEANGTLTNWDTSGLSYDKYTLRIEATDQSGNTKVVERQLTVNEPPAPPIVEDKTPPKSPMVNPVLDYSRKLKGWAEDSDIYVYVGSKLIAKKLSHQNGPFAIDIPTQKAGTIITVIAIDQAGNQSIPTKIKVIDKTPPIIEKIDPIYSTTKYVKGKTEPFVTVYVKRGSTVLGIAKSNSKGLFSVVIKPQRKGTILTIVAKDQVGNVSTGKIIKVR